MSHLRSLSRGLSLLDLLIASEAQAGAPRSLGVVEIAHELNVDKSSASRLAATLADHGYLQRDPVSKRYQLGVKLRTKMSVRDVGPLLREHAHPFLVQLVDVTGECAHTAVLAEDRALIVDDVEAKESALRVTAGIGRTMLLHCTAVGKALLAFAEVPIPAHLPRKTERTFVDRGALEEELERARVQGFAFDDVENEPGVRCLAAPVRNAVGRTIACVGISGPEVRMPDARIEVLARHVVATARRISAAIGHTPPQEPGA